MRGTSLPIALSAVLGLSSISYSPLTLADEPFAIKAEVPKRLSKHNSRRLAVMNLRSAKVPGANEVGVPVYIE